MTPKQSQVAFLSWLKQSSPTVYQRAVKRGISRTTLSGLGDDLTSDITLDDTAGSAIGSSIDTSSADDAINAAVSSTSSTSDWSDIFSGIANAVTQIAPAIVTSQAQSQLITLNAQRAAAGLPPLTSTALTTGTGLSSISPTMIMVILALGGGLLLLSKKGK